MRLTYADLLTLERGLSALSAGKPQPDGTRKALRLPITATMAISENLINVRRGLEPYHAAARSVFESMPLITIPSPEGPARQVAPTNIKEFQDKTADLLAQVVTVRLFKIKAVDLKIGDKPEDNEVNGLTLADLDRVLDRTGLQALEEIVEA